MSTNSGFTPAADAPCYAPRMTRAAALALRAASGLRENCVVVITDGPTIGTASLTSATEIELNPTSPTEFGLAARVHTGYDNTAWTGQYDIDFGTGTLIELRDNIGNVVIDRFGGTLQTQFPWGRPLVRRNFIMGDMDLLNWDVPAALGATISENTITGGEGLTTVNLLGLGAAVPFVDNTITSSIVRFLGTATAAANSIFSSNTVRDNFQFTINSTAPGQLFVDGNDFHDHNASNAGDDLMHTSTGSLILDGNKFRALGVGARYTFSGTNSVIMRGNDFNDATITKSGGTSLTMTNNHLDTGSYVFSATAGASDMTANKLFGSVFTISGSSGAMTCTGNVGSNVTLNRPGGATSPYNVSLNTGNAWTFTQSNSASQSVSIQNNDIQTGVHTHGGTGTYSITSSVVLASSGVNTSPTSTRGISVVSSLLNNATITQSRGGGAVADTIQDSRLAQAAINLNGSADPGGTQTVMNACDVLLSTVTLADPVTTTILQGVTVAASTLTVPAGGGLQNGLKLASGANLNTGAFTSANTIIEGAFTKTFTAANVNRLCSKAFDDIL